MFNLIFRPGPGDGPEPKMLKQGYDMPVTPNVVFPVKLPHVAIDLVDRVKRIQPADEATKKKLQAAREQIAAAAQKAAEKAAAKAAAAAAQPEDSTPEEVSQ